MTEIYALCDPKTGCIRYIGQSKDSAERLKRHIRDARRRTTPVYLWISELASKGLVPVVKVLEVTENGDDGERKQIELSRARGDHLLNVSDGGKHIFISDEQRSANGKIMNERLAANKKLHQITKIKRQIASALKEGHVTNETRAKLRYAAWKRPDLFGLWLTLEDRVEA